MKSQQTDHLFHHQGALLLALTSILGKSTLFLSSGILTAVLTFLSPSTAQTPANPHSEGSSGRLGLLLPGGTLGCIHL